MTPSRNPLDRRVLACAVAMLVLLALTGAIFLTRRSLGGWMTPIGLVAPLDLLAVAVAMGVGGAVARQGFVRWAVLLVVLVGLTSAIAAYGYAPPTQSGVIAWLARNTALQLVLSALVAGGAALAGERLGARRRITP